MPEGDQVVSKKRRRFEDVLSVIRPKKAKLEIVGKGFPDRFVFLDNSMSPVSLEAEISIICVWVK